MKGKNIFALIATILWALVLLVSFDLIGSVRSQHVPGFPSSGQMRYYIYFPAVSLAVVIAVWVLAARRRQLKTLATTLIEFSLFVLPIYLFFYMGGV